MDELDLTHLDEPPSELDSAMLYIKRLERKLAARDARILELEERESRAWGYYRARGQEIEKLKQHVTPYTLQFLGMAADEED